MASGDKGFDQIQAPHMVDELQVQAFNGKEVLVSAPTVEQYRFNNLEETSIREVPVIGGNRIRIEGAGVDKLTFDETSLLVGLFSSDFAVDGKEVKAYYPHVRGGQTVSKTVFLMSPDTAATLAKKLASFQDIDPQTLANGLSGMSTRFTLYGENAFKIHSKDAAPALAGIIQKSLPDPNLQK